MEPIASPHAPGGARVLVIADSLALPRGDIDYSQTWPAMLAARVPQIAWINRAQRLSTTERLNDEGNSGADCLDFYQPQLVILQLGICDCAPRVLSRRTAAFIHRLPLGLGRRIPIQLERLRGRKAGNCFVSLAAYEANLRAYVARAARSGTSVVAISIMPATRLLRQKNPGVVPQIASYNAVLDSLASEFANFEVVHPLQAGASVDDFFVDGYHLNERGARLVADRLEPLAVGTAASHARNA
ncbi:MAG: SGNH/GDSL hydrolase family protein [Burkholderiales bacterium]|nr:SGNH/GDSL hydrolase family protein [Burkholderiales bacterium]